MSLSSYNESGFEIRRLMRISIDQPGCCTCFQSSLDLKKDRNFVLGYVTNTSSFSAIFSKGKFVQIGNESVPSQNGNFYF